MTHWTDKSAILRDLSFAQGRRVPAVIAAAVAGAKPPSHNIVEDTEEEYYSCWIGDGDHKAGPDSFGIKEALQMVQAEDMSHMEENMKYDTLNIYKASSTANEFVPKKQKVNTSKQNEINNKARNVAIDSLLSIKSKEDNRNKVNSWLQSQNITSMFKKKSVGTSSTSESSQNAYVWLESQKSKETPMFKKKCHNTKSTEHNVKPANNSGNIGVFTPSPAAQEYYNKLLERSQMTQLVKDDMWTRLEKEMKELDKAKAEPLRLKEGAEREHAKMNSQTNSSKKVLEKFDTTLHFEEDNCDPDLIDFEDHFNLQDFCEEMASCNITSTPVGFNHSCEMEALQLGH